MKRIFFGWYIVAAGLLLMVYNSGALVYGFTAFIDPLALAYGWSYAQISLATSIRGMEVGALNPLLGFIVDRWHARILVPIGVVIWGLGLFLLGRADTLPLFYGSFLVIGLGSSLGAQLVPTVVVARWFKKDIGKANGVMAMGMGIGGALIPIIIKMIDMYGIQGALTILAAGACILGLPLSLLFRNRPEDHGMFPDGKIPEVAESGRTLQMPESSIGLRQALKMRAFWQIGIFFLIQVAIMLAMQTHVMPYLENLGVERTTAGVVAMALPLVSLGARIPFGWLADIFPKKYVVAVSLGLKALGLFLFWFIGLTGTVSLGMVIFFIIAFGLGSGGMTPLRAPIIREYFGIGRFGTILGFMSIFSTIGLALGPLAAGWVFDSSGTYVPIWLTLGLVAVFGVFLMLVLPQVSERSGTVAG